MDRYIGLDVHATSTTLAVVGPSGRRLKTLVVETNGKALIEVLKTIPEPRHVCLEEGTQAEWLFQVLKPHATEVVVAKVENSRGQKNDVKDAFGLAELLRTGKIGSRVFKDVGAFATLRDLSRLYTMLRDDVVRTKNRIRASIDRVAWRRPMATCTQRSIERSGSRRSRPASDSLQRSSTTSSASRAS